MAASTKKVIFVLGPTAGGKSAWALNEAVRIGGSIINVDSVQFYKGLEVGSAGPTKAEKLQAPHFLYSYVEAPSEMTAGKYVEDFYKLLADPKLKFPLFIVGGTGFYIQALEKGLFDIKPIPDEVKKALEDELIQRGAQALHDEVLKADPASKIHVNDHYRVVRALEIIRTTGKIPTEMKNEQNYKNNDFPFPYLKLGFAFAKEDFLVRVKARTDFMIQAGLIEETSSFLNRNLDGWAPLSSVGYKETTQFLRENKTKDWLRENIIVSTMQLIKKQKTWFKRDPSVLWSDHSAHFLRFLRED